VTIFKSFQKKPVVIAAAKLTESNAQEIAEWIKRYNHEARVVDGGQIEIKTLEGNMLAQVGDFIIRGVKWEFYPCKPDIFEETYDEVDAEVDELPF